jgi:hypothetical protein
MFEVEAVLESCTPVSVRARCTECNSFICAYITEDRNDDPVVLTLSDTVRVLYVSSLSL